MTSPENPPTEHPKFGPRTDFEEDVRTMKTYKEGEQVVQPPAGELSETLRTIEEDAIREPMDPEIEDIESLRLKLSGRRESPTEEPPEAA